MNTIIGTWTLSSLEIHIDGQIQKPFGEKITGLLIYQENGYMSGIICGENRPQISRPALFGIPEEERLAISDHFIAYGGKYSIEGDTVSHQVLASFVPNLMHGAPHSSKFSVKDGQLTISSEAAPQTGKKVAIALVWERVS